MTELGIFIRTWQGLPLQTVFEKMADQGLFWGHFSMSCMGSPTIPERVEPEKIRLIKRWAADSGIRLASLSGTFNILHSGVEEFDHFSNLTEIAAALSIPCITICTGSCSSRSMWSPHPDNNLPETWDRMTDAVERLLLKAETANIILGVEPEPSNIVKDALCARRLLDHFHSSHLKIVMDGANLLAENRGIGQKAILEQAFSLLGCEIISAHGKDLTKAGAFTAAGNGLMDYTFYLNMLKDSGYTGPLLLHQLTEDQIPFSVRHVRDAEKCIGDIGTKKIR